MTGRKTVDGDPRLLIGPEVGDLIWQVDDAGNIVVGQADRVIVVAMTEWLNHVGICQRDPAAPDQFALGTPDRGLGRVVYRVLCHSYSFGRGFVLLGRVDDDRSVP